MAIQLSNLSVVPGATPDLQQDLRTYTIQGSTEFIFPKNGVVDIYCIGAGGSGAATSEAGRGATGGGAGGTAVMRNVTVTTSDSIIFSCGVGGVSSSSWNANGVSGNASTVNSNTLSISLTANGGQAGSRDPLPTVSASLGGNASGGTENYTGGSGGSITVPNSASNTISTRVSTGGGSVGLNKNGFSGGNITATGNQNYYILATGGGGQGGTSPINTSNSIKVSSGGGGLGSGYISNNNLNNTNASSESTQPGAGSAVGASLLKLDGIGGRGQLLSSSSSSGGTGGGGGGNLGENTRNIGGTGGAFGGGGGSSGTRNVSSNNLTYSRAGYGGIGSGGGGVSYVNTYNIPLYSISKGGDGALMIVYKSIQE